MKYVAALLLSWWLNEAGRNAEVKCHAHLNPERSRLHEDGFLGFYVELGRGGASDRWEGRTLVKTG